MPGSQAAITGIDEQLLLVTSSYRFLLTTPRRLLLLEEFGIPLAQVEAFERDERVCVVARWDSLKRQEVIALLTTHGLVRLVGTGLATDRLERSIPLILEEVPRGVPISVLGVSGTQQLVAITDAGRAARVQLSGSAQQSIQLLRKGAQERLAGFEAVGEADLLLLIAPNGAVRQVAVAAIPRSSASNLRGRVIASRFAVASAAVWASQAALWILTSTRLRRLGDALLPMEAPAGKRPGPLLLLEPGEQIIALLSSDVDVVPAWVSI